MWENNFHQQQLGVERGRADLWKVVLGLEDSDQQEKELAQSITWIHSVTMAMQQGFIWAFHPWRTNHGTLWHEWEMQGCS